MYKSYLIVVLAAMFSACGANQDKEALQEEDREAKEKLQGIGWTTIRKLPCCKLRAIRFIMLTLLSLLSLLKL